MEKQTYTKRTLLINALKEAEEHFLLYQDTFKLSMTETTLKLDTFDMSIVIKHRKEPPCGCR